ncbi:MAG TPA: phosphoribosyltransferase [Ktedonobacteraceae bacterium]
MVARYQDRFDAGRQLATCVQAYANRPNVLILALPRGGVPVAFAVASALHVPLDLFLVRKLGVPGQEELALGAIATGNVRVLNNDVVQSLRISEQTIEQIARREEQELARRERLYRDDRPPPDLRDRIIILIDDGLATGASMRAAARAVRRQHPARLVVAVPVAAPSACEEFQSEADEVICTYTPEPFYGVGWWYHDFAQVSDREVHNLLARAGGNQPVSGKKDR